MRRGQFAEPSSAVVMILKFWLRFKNYERVCHWSFGPGKIGPGGPFLPWKFWSGGPKLPVKMVRHWKYLSGQSAPLSHASESQSFQAFLWHKKLPSISFQTANASSFQAGPGILIKKTLSAPGKVLVLF